MASFKQDKDHWGQKSMLRVHAEKVSQKPAKTWPKI